MRGLVALVSALAFVLMLAAPGVALAKKSSSKGKWNVVKLAKSSSKNSSKSSDKASFKSVKNGPVGAVPEPSAALAFAVGLGALGLSRRRRAD